MDFVEICNVCTRKVIINAAKRIFNSDKICGSYCDFYFGVTFLEHTVYLNYVFYSCRLTRAVLWSFRRRPTWSSTTIDRSRFLTTTKSGLWSNWTNTSVSSRASKYCASSPNTQSSSRWDNRMVNNDNSDNIVFCYSGAITVVNSIFKLLWRIFDSKILNQEVPHFRGVRKVRGAAKKSYNIKQFIIK